MSAFPRRYKRKTKVCLLICLVSAFAVSFLLIYGVQDLTDRSLHWRISFSRIGEQSSCHLFDAVDLKLVKILEQLNPINQENGDGNDNAKRLTTAVQTLADNELMVENRYIRRLFYLADVLQAYRDRLLMREKGRRSGSEEDAAKRKIVDLVRIFENLTDAKTKLRNKELTTPSQRIGVYRTNKRNAKNWQLFHSEITQRSLYSDRGDRPLVDRLLLEMSSLPVKNLRPLTDRGTQLKLVFVLEDDSRVLFKPRRLPRDYAEPLDVYYMYEVEKHTAEIAAFHLDRILGFNRVPPVAGRYIDMLKDVNDFAEDEFKDTFYKSPAGNQCFFGRCTYFCQAAHGICGNGTTLEGSAASYLPSRRIAPRTHHSNPWSRSYSRLREAEWETAAAAKDGGAGYCRSVREEMPWSDPRAILHLIDAHLFDFFTGNKDRHHFEVFRKYGNASYPILYDNGKGFGRAFDDITSILAPLRQCCLIRQSTLKRLLELATGDEKLSELMRKSLSKDVLTDILTDAHLQSLDRRLTIILGYVYECILHSTPELVVLDIS